MRKVVKELFGRDLFKVQGERTALLVIDMQNTFVAKGAVFEAPKGREIIPKLEEMIKYCRKKNMPVIWTRSDHSPPGGGLIIERYPVIKFRKEVWKGTKSFEYYSKMIQPLPKEHQIVKHKYDAFIGTDLDMVLKNLEVDTVIIGGVFTEVCCESTARAAFFRDYKVVFLADATAGSDPSTQDDTVKRMETFYGRGMKVSEVIEEIEENS